MLMVVSLPLQPRRVINGFIAGGAVDEITRQWPDFDKIIATCRRDVKKEEVDCIITNFTRLYNAFLQHGKVPEEIYDEIGLDEDMDGIVLFDLDVPIKIVFRERCVCQHLRCEKEEGNYWNKQKNSNEYEM